MSDDAVPAFRAPRRASGTWGRCRSRGPCASSPGSWSKCSGRGAAGWPPATTPTTSSTSRLAAPVREPRPPVSFAVDNPVSAASRPTAAGSDVRAAIETVTPILAFPGSERIELVPSARLGARAGRIGFPPMISGNPRGLKHHHTLQLLAQPFARRPPSANKPNPLDGRNRRNSSGVID